MQQLGAAGLVDVAAGADGAEGGWTRIVIEKPFGRDLATRAELNASVGHGLPRGAGLPHRPLPRERDRPEHLAFRFANSILESLWNREHIDHVQITVAESIGVEGRGAVLRGVRRPARHGRQPHAPGALAGGDGAAGRTRRRRRPRRESQGAAGHAPARTRPRWRAGPCAASTARARSTASRCRATARRSGSIA